MTSEEALTILKNTKKPYIISGFKVKEPNGTELNFITQHYTINAVILHINTKQIVNDGQ